MKDAVKGGYQFNIDSHLYIGKAFHEGEWKISKVYSIGNHMTKGLCTWDSHGKQTCVLKFHLLKYNYTTATEDCVTILNRNKICK